MPTQPVRPNIPKFKLGYLFSGKNKRNLQRYNEDYAMYQWQMENWYNDPSNAMKRYREAGLNPNLVYGDISAGNAGSAGKMPNVEPYAPIDRASNVADMVLNRFMDGKMKLAQIKDTEAAARLKGAQATDLLKEIESKDKRWFDVNSNKVMDIDPRKLPYRDRQRYIEMATKTEQYLKEYQNAKSAKHQQEILGKINDLKNTMLIIQMVSSLGGVVGRFGF